MLKNKIWVNAITVLSASFYSLFVCLFICLSLCLRLSLSFSLYIFHFLSLFACLSLSTITSFIFSFHLSCLFLSLPLSFSPSLSFSLSLLCLFLPLPISFSLSLSLHFPYLFCLSFPLYIFVFVSSSLTGKHSFPSPRPPHAASPRRSSAPTSPSRCVSMAVVGPPATRMWRLYLRFTLEATLAREAGFTEGSKSAVKSWDGNTRRFKG